MMLHPDLQHARPLMVVGAPRCGTRFVAKTLNRHPSILVQGEIPSRAMDNAVRFLSETGDFFASEPRWSATWENGRRDLLYAIWTSMLKGTPRGTRAPITWFGHKTPRHDRYWEFYRRFVGDIDIKYVFCMRKFVDHYLSMTSIVKHRNVNSVPLKQDRIKFIARDYRASVACYADMKLALGDSVSLFLLDDLREGGIDYVRETLFERLGIGVDHRTLARIDVSQRANPTEARGSRRTELTAEEIDFLNRNRDLKEALEALRAASPLGSKIHSAA
jgi:hypothetical protein